MLVRPDRRRARCRVTFHGRAGLRLRRRPLLQHARTLPDSQPYPRPMLNRIGEQLASLFQVVAGVEQAIDLRAVLRPLLDLVEIKVVRTQRVVSLFVGPFKLVF